MGAAEPATGPVTPATAGDPLPLAVLLLEDREADAELMLYELRRGGFLPTAVRVGTEAAFLSELGRPFDVILADYALPQFDAGRALDHLLARGIDTPVIIVSGALTDEEALECVARGASDYLLKDRLGRLPFAVRRVLADQAAERRMGEQRLALLQEQAARTVAEAERAQLHRLFEQAPAAICLLSGPEHVYTLANAPYRQLVGERELLGRPIRQALPELAGQGIYELLDQVYASGAPHAGQEVPARLDRGRGEAEEAWFNFLYAPTRDAAGMVEGIFVHAVEVTAQVRARLQVMAERDRLQQVIEALPEGVAICDEHGRVIQSNAAARAIWGQPPPPVDIHGYEAFAALRMDGSPYPSEELPLARSVLAGEIVHADQMLVRNATTRRETPVLVNSAPLLDADGRITGGVAVFQDITALKELDRQKDAFLAAASHDLKNPLAAVRAQAQLLERRLRSGRAEEDRLLEGIARIGETAMRAGRLVEQLLDVTRRQMGLEIELQRGPVDLVGLAHRVVDEQQHATERHQILVEAATPSVVGTWDEARLDRLLENLVSNAVKYSPHGGTVRVGVHLEGAMAVLTVQDEGVGIPADQLPHVFQRFFRARNAVGRFEGSGIGLDSARHIAEAHGGQISVQSREGAGTTMRVELPLTTPGGESASASTSSH